MSKSKTTIEVPGVKARKPKTDPEVTKKIKDDIIHSRIQMLLNMPFFGNLAVRLKIVDGSGWLNTLATDGKHFYYCADFVQKMDQKELIFGMAHEVMHCVYDHMDRRGSRNANLWNQAADYVINGEIVDAGVGKLIHWPAKFKGDPDACEPCHDEKYRGMSADQVYELLKNECDSSEHSFDVHIGNGSGELGDDVEYDPDGFYGPIPMSDEEKKNLEDEIKQAVMQAALAAAGNVPAGVKRMIKDLTEPKMNWREHLNALLQSTVKNDYTFSRPNKKNSSMGGIILPGMNVDVEVSAFVAIDTSGSISEKMIADFLGEVKGIMEQFNAFDIRVVCFDTTTYKIWHYNNDNAEDICLFEPQGGGGTTFESVWERMIKEDIVPDQLIFFTDGYPCGHWCLPGHEDYCDTTFVIIGSDTIVAPFGTTLYYSED